MSKETIVDVARRILSGGIDPLEGCRSIVDLQGDLSESEREDSSFVMLVAIGSETDDLPMGATRHLWTRVALPDAERRRAAYVDRVSDDLLNACKAIVDKFSGIAMSRAKIVTIARQILGGGIHPFEGCRAIVSLRGSLAESETNDPDFGTFIAIESEIDDLPSATTRHLWDPTALAEKDRIADEYLSRVRETLLGACTAVIGKFSR